jgi:hypothetical protein
MNGIPPRLGEGFRAQILILLEFPKPSLANQLLPVAYPNRFLTFRLKP